MLSNSLGQVENEVAIFPLISFNRGTGAFRCLGTGFFIHEEGWFVTAKHNMYDNSGKLYPMLMAVQTLSDQRRVSREVTHLSVHPSADIVIGQLGISRDITTAREVGTEVTPYFQLWFDKLSTNEEVIAYGYPKTSKSVVETKSTFTFNGVWSRGSVQDFHADGSPLVRNRCYQTSMKIETGASGGPVIWNNKVVGINSSGFDLPEHETPLSYITPIDFILDLNIAAADDAWIPIKDLIRSGVILAYPSNPDEGRTGRETHTPH